MALKRVMIGLAVVAGAGVYISSHPAAMAGGRYAWNQAVSVVASVRPLAQALHLSNQAAGGKAGSPHASSHVTSATVTDTSKASPQSGVQSGAVSAVVPAVTTDNAPTPTPTVLNGVHMQYDPFKPSDGPYPQLPTDGRVWIDVSISQQLAYVFDGDKRLYTMVTSSGIDTSPDTSTPLGVYHIQGERGTWFYASQYQEGAQYWVSWLGHGVFLFHSVPETQNHQLIMSVAAALGHPASHGCFHLTIPDSQWVYNNIPQGTTVVVEQAPVKLQGNLLYDPSKDQAAAELGSQNASATASGTSSAASTTPSSISATSNS